MIYISFQSPKKSHIITLWAVYTKLCRHLPVIYHKNGRHHSKITNSSWATLSLCGTPPLKRRSTGRCELATSVPLFSFRATKEAHISFQSSTACSFIDQSLLFA